MRSTLAVAIAVLISLPLLAPFFALGSSAAVPACCRRNGQHHCMGGTMQMPGSDQGASIIAPRCPRFPIASMIPQVPGFVAGNEGQVGVNLFVRPTALPQTEAGYRIAFARSRQKRGPPVIPS
jgi:hypothetical protein